MPACGFAKLWLDAATTLAAPPSTPGGQKEKCTAKSKGWVAPLAEAGHERLLKKSRNLLRNALLHTGSL
jgi:hypothetical protein